jgi:hypothetical protein
MSTAGSPRPAAEMSAPHYRCAPTDRAYEVTGDLTRDGRVPLRALPTFERRRLLRQPRCPRIAADGLGRPEDLRGHRRARRCGERPPSVLRLVRLANPFGVGPISGRRHPRGRHPVTRSGIQPTTEAWCLDRQPWGHPPPTWPSRSNASGGRQAPEGHAGAGDRTPLEVAQGRCSVRSENARPRIVNGQVDVLAGGQRESSLVANECPRGSCLLVGGAVGEPVAVAGGGDDVGVVAEPVEQADGGGLVGQEAAPVLEG